MAQRAILIILAAMAVLASGDELFPNGKKAEQWEPVVFPIAFNESKVGAAAGNFLKLWNNASVPEPQKYIDILRRLLAIPPLAKNFDAFYMTHQFDMSRQLHKALKDEQGLSKEAKQAWSDAIAQVFSQKAPGKTVKEIFAEVPAKFADDAEKAKQTAVGERLSKALGAARKGFSKLFE